MYTTLLNFYKVSCRYRGLIGGLLVVLTMLSAPATSIAQQPAPTPEEFMASKPEDIVGIWETRFWQEDAYLRFNADGAYIVASTLEALEDDHGHHGTFWFEEMVLHVKDYRGEGTYEVRVKTEGDTRVHLSFQVLSDPFRARTRDWTKGMPRFEPSAQASE
jgi:hypothetical protein